MTDLAAWLLEQIDADELWAKIASTRDTHNETELAQLLGSVGRKQVAECEAKRRIVGACADVLGHSHGYWEHTDAPDLAEDTLRALALPYANRPGYLHEWHA